MTEAIAILRPGADPHHAIGRSWRCLFRSAIGLTRNAVDAEDLVQETFAKAFAASGRFQPDTTSGGGCTGLCSTHSPTTTARGSGRRCWPRTPPAGRRTRPGAGLGRGAPGGGARPRARHPCRDRGGDQDPGTWLPAHGVPGRRGGPGLPADRRDDRHLDRDREIVPPSRPGPAPRHTRRYQYRPAAGALWPAPPGTFGLIPADAI